MTIQPRLLPDFAAVPTRRERAAVRAHWRAAAPSLFDPDADEPPTSMPCAVCASAEHLTEACPIGTAPTLEMS